MVLYPQCLRRPPAILRTDGTQQLVSPESRAAAQISLAATKYKCLSSSVVGVHSWSSSVVVAIVAGSAAAAAAVTALVVLALQP